VPFSNSDSRQFPNPEPYFQEAEKKKKGLQVGVDLDQVLTQKLGKDGNAHKEIGTYKKGRKNKEVMITVPPQP
jgi:hypothetical protein